MAQVYQSASIKLGSEVITIIYVSYAAIATDEMAARALAAMKPLFKNSTVVLAAQGQPRAGIRRPQARGGRAARPCAGRVQVVSDFDRLTARQNFPRNSWIFRPLERRRPDP